MIPEAEQPEQAAADAPRVEPAPTKRRAGLPVWRTGKPDVFLAAAVDAARTAIEGITDPSNIGAHVAAKSEGDRLVTHLFESKLPGYQGWQWYAVLTRNSRSKVVTVSELGLLPSEDSILSPEWVPWAERVRPGDEQGEVEAADAALPSAAVDEDEPETEEALNAAQPPEDDSDDADGNADGAGDEYDADDVDDAGDEPREAKTD
ncbi:DUF3027 domain-containing protein [Pseudarthrobacter sp. DSP2-3-2b1]|uniref:DUF3027 domain-containing protein n=1 Tax=Pseudarthrobacter sp. DSP2-3-2b1 TaxID=2804661 RepID=UPI003CE8A899